MSNNQNHMGGAGSMTNNQSQSVPVQLTSPTFKKTSNLWLVPATPDPIVLTDKESGPIVVETNHLDNHIPALLAAQSQSPYALSPTTTVASTSIATATKLSSVAVLRQQMMSGMSNSGVVLSKSLGIGGVDLAHSVSCGSNSSGNAHHNTKLGTAALAGGKEQESHVAVGSAL